MHTSEKLQDHLVNKLRVGFGPKYFYVLVSGQQKPVLQAGYLIAQ